MRYLGWKNYETWCINLWLEQEDYFRSLDYEMEVADLASQIKDFVEEFKPEIPNSMYSDLLNAAISCCDFYEIAENALEA